MGTVVHDPSVDNGVVAIFVQNVLTGPIAGPEVEIILSVSGGKDLQFSVPKTIELPMTSLQVQGGEEKIDGKDHTFQDKMSLSTVGETIISLRPLLHRTTFSYSQMVGSIRVGESTFLSTGLSNNVNYFPRLPPEYGYDSLTGLSWAQKLNSEGNTPFNFSSFHPINWVLMAFVGYRGSTNIHGNITSGTDIGPVNCFSATRSRLDFIVNPTTQYRNCFSVAVNGNVASSTSRMAVSYSGTRPRKAFGHGGMSLTNTQTQSALSVNLPMYSQWKFMPAWAKYRDFVPQNSDRSVGIRLNDNVRFDTQFFNKNTVSSTTTCPIVTGKQIGRAHV